MRVPVSEQQVDAITSVKRATGRRDDVIDCAARVFNRMGLRGATLSDVATELGLNITTIRHYFPKREDLVAAVVERMLATNARWLNDAMVEPTPEARLRRLTRSVFAFRQRVAEGAEPDIIHFSELRSMRSPHSDRIWPLYSDMFRSYRALICKPEEIEADRIRANTRAHILLSQFLRVVLWLPNYQPADFQRVEQRFLDVMINGIASPDYLWSPRPVEIPLQQGGSSLSAEAFLAAATQIINQEGERGASVQRIAASLNVTKGSFYHHINAKGDLVADCCERTVQILKKTQNLAIKSETRGMDQAVASIAALLLLQRQPGALIRTSALVSIEPEKRARFTSELDRISLRFADMISDGMIDGSGRICDARIAGDIAMSFVGASEEAHRWVPGLTADLSLDLYTRMLFTGVLA